MPEAAPAPGIPAGTPPPAPAPPADAEACPLCGQAVSPGAPHAALAMLVARQEEALRRMQAPSPRGWWERMPVVVGVLGLLFTILYQVNQVVDHREEQRRAEDARRLELMSKFFPHLVSSDPAEQRGAIVALDLLADSTLAAAAALVAPSEAAASALREVRMNPVSLQDPGYVGSVARRLPSLRAVTRPPSASGAPPNPVP